jgi:integrase
MILRSALSDAVKHGRLTHNPTDRSTSPTPSRARPPQMRAWTAKELGAFLALADCWDCEAAIAYRLIAATGMRRGEALALCWRDVDLDAGGLSVRRSVGLVKHAGDGEELVEGSTKTGRAGVVDLDGATVGRLRAYRAQPVQVSKQLGADAALVLGHLDGSYRHQERFSR